MPPWRPETRVLVVGDVFVDYAVQDRIVRLGGVFHAARALDAFGVSYALAFVAPSYLDGAIERFASDLSADRAQRVGLVEGSPAVMLVREQREAGDQGYDDLLRDARSTSWDHAAFATLVTEYAPTDVLVFPGQYPVSEAITGFKGSQARLHCDVQYDADLDSLVSAVGRPFETVFVSTSSRLFQNDARGAPGLLRENIPATAAKILVLKENRGGSRAFLGDSITEVAEAPSFPTRTTHSIGVGDSFDCAWICADDEPTVRLRRAAYISSLYAATWDHRRFVGDVNGAAEMDATIVELDGIRLPWERRQELELYIAAPDFPDVDTEPLDQLENALRYHNFSPRRPVRENGLFDPQMSEREQRQMYLRDRSLLENASALVAVPLTPDAGTFAELGVANGLGIPTILWNRGGVVRNLFAAKLADRVCLQLSDVVEAVFALTDQNRGPR